MPRAHARILVVDSDTKVRRALEAGLTDAGYEVRLEADGVDIDGVLDTFRPQLAIVASQLATGPRGFELGRRLRRFRHVPVIFLTAPRDVEERLAGFEAGADDCVAKPVEPSELVARIRALLRRCEPVSSPHRQVGDAVIDEDACVVIRGDQPVDLTPTEYELFKMLARNTGTVVSKQQMLSEIWGRRVRDLNVIEVHMSSLRHKLEAHGPRLVHTVRGQGYVVRPPQSQPREPAHASAARRG